MKKRLEFIDIAKGIGILFVLLNHVESYQWVTFSSFFVIPIFFFCSGYTFSFNQEEKFRFITVVKKLPKLLKPYFFFSVLLLLIFNDFSLRAISGIVYSRYCFFPIGTDDVCRLFIVGNFPLWFLTCMSLCYLFYAVYLRFFKYKYIVMAVYFLASVVMSYLPILLPWSFDTAPLLTIFMILGREVKERNLLAKKWFLLMCVIVYISALRITDGVNVSVREYGSSLSLYLVVGFAGCMILTNLALLLEKSKACRIPLVLLGRHSLTIFCIETPFLVLGKDIAHRMAAFYPIFEHTSVVSILQFMCALIGGFVLSWLLNKNRMVKQIVL